MVLRRRDHHASLPPMMPSEAVPDFDEEYPDVTPRVRGGRASASRRVSRIMSMALPSRIMARFFPESSARKSIRTSKISEPILINSTNIATPTPKPRAKPVRPASMYDARSKRFSSYEDYNMVHLRTSAMVSPGTTGIANFF